MTKGILEEIFNSKRKSQELESVCNSIDLLSQVLMFAVDSEDNELFDTFYPGYCSAVADFEKITHMAYINCEIEFYAATMYDLPFA